MFILDIYSAQKILKNHFGVFLNLGHEMLTALRAFTPDTKTKFFFKYFNYLFV